jgi:hypothetical protein
MVPLKNWQALNCMIYCPDNHWFPLRRIPAAISRTFASCRTRIQAWCASNATTVPSVLRFSCLLIFPAQEDSVGRETSAARVAATPVMRRKTCRTAESSEWRSDVSERQVSFPSIASGMERHRVWSPLIAPSIISILSRSAPAIYTCPYQDAISWHHNSAITLPSCSDMMKLDSTGQKWIRSRLFIAKQTDLITKIPAMPATNYHQK